MGTRLNDTIATGVTALRIMQTAGISQADIARELGTSRQWIHDVLAGRARPSPAFMRDVSIALAYRLSVDSNELHQIFFSDEPTDELASSVLSRRVAEASE